MGRVRGGREQEAKPPAAQRPRCEDNEINLLVIAGCWSAKATVKTVADGHDAEASGETFDALWICTCRSWGGDGEAMIRRRE
jgi:hypothetical protein